jgi:hypothetical protein
MPRPESAFLATLYGTLWARAQEEIHQTLRVALLLRHSLNENQWWNDSASTVADVRAAVRRAREAQRQLERAKCTPVVPQCPPDSAGFNRTQPD